MAGRRRIPGRRWASRLGARRGGPSSALPGGCAPARTHRCHPSSAGPGPPPCPGPSRGPGRRAWTYLRRGTFLQRTVPRRKSGGASPFGGRQAWQRWSCRGATRRTLHKTARQARTWPGKRGRGRREGWRTRSRICAALCFPENSLGTSCRDSSEFVAPDSAGTDRQPGLVPTANDICLCPGLTTEPTIGRGRVRGTGSGRLQGGTPAPTPRAVGAGLSLSDESRSLIGRPYSI